MWALKWRRPFRDMGSIANFYTRRPGKNGKSLNSQQLMETILHRLTCCLFGKCYKSARAGWRSPPPPPGFNVGFMKLGTVDRCKIVSIRAGVEMSIDEVPILKKRGQGEGHRFVWKAQGHQNRCKIVSINCRLRNMRECDQWGSSFKYRV
jgi:hypothetical protein